MMPPAMTQASSETSRERERERGWSSQLWRGTPGKTREKEEHGIKKKKESIRCSQLCPKHPAIPPKKGKNKEKRET